MTIKCRSCGHLNKENKSVCENCGCNLKYSQIFEKMLEKDKLDSGFLFEIEEEKQGKTSNLLPNDFLMDSEAEDDLLNTTFDPAEEFKPVSTKTPAPKKERPITKSLENNEKILRKFGIIVSMELIVFLFFFSVLFFGEKFVLKNFEIPVSETIKASVITYLFFNIQSILLSGKLLSFHFLQKKEGENSPLL